MQALTRTYGKAPKSSVMCPPQMKNWKRRYFLLDENAVSYFKSDLVRTAIRRLLPATDKSARSSVCVLNSSVSTVNKQQHES